MGPELVAIAITVGTLFATVAGAMAAAGRRPVPHQEAAEARWREAAERLEGELEVGGRKKALVPRRLDLRAHVEGAKVRLATDVPVDPSTAGHTRGVAPYALGAGPTFRLEPSAGPRGEVALIGDAELERRHRLVTDDPDAVDALFDASLREALAAFHRRATVWSDGRVVRVEWDGAEGSVKAIVDAARMLARASLFGVAPLRTLADLDGAAWVASDDGPRVVVTRAHVAVSILGEATRGGVAYAAWADAAVELPAFDVALDDDGAVDGELPAGVLDPEVAPVLSEVGAARLIATAHEVRLTWRDTPDRRRADAGVRLVAAIAGGGRSRGAFR